MATVAIIVAAGRGLRLGGEVPKQYQDLAGKAVLRRTVENALATVAVNAVLVAIGADARALYDAAVAGLDTPRLRPPVTGGATRAETVRRALEAMETDPPDAVLIHDAARPFAPPELWAELARLATEGRGAIAAEPVVDALWRSEDGDASVPVRREDLWRAQTPQAFPYRLILAAHRLVAEQPGAAPFDDAEVFRRAGYAVRLVGGDPDNFKITTPRDMERAARLLRARSGDRKMDIRMGHGFDVHRFCEGDHVTLCGVNIPHTQGLSGHSDADVGLHALADAIYGALAEGDIGQHFPPSDEKWRGAPSHIFLAHAGERAAQRRARIANVDMTFLCEAPKIGPHAAAMRERVAAILKLDLDRVSVKATTMERMGFVGREEGMGCLATATLVVEAAE